MPIHLFHFSINTLCQWRFQERESERRKFHEEIRFKNIFALSASSLVHV